MGLAQSKRQIVSVPTDDEMPKPKVAETVRIVGVVHPFFVHNCFLEWAKDEKIPEKRLERYFRDTGSLPYMIEELRIADRTLEILRTEVKNPGSRLLIAGHKLSAEDFQTLSGRYTSGFFDQHPGDMLLDQKAEADKSKGLKSMGLQCRHYDESWFVAQALRIFHPSRVIFYPYTVDMADIHGRFTLPAREGRVGGVFMGTYAENCVKYARDDVCHALNIPPDSIPIRESASISRILPIKSERITMAEEKQETTTWHERMRDTLREYRSKTDIGTEKGGTPSILLKPAMIKTYLLHPEFMQRTFERYRLTTITKSLTDNGMAEHATSNPQAADIPAIAESIADFISNPLTKRTAPAENTPWAATPAETMEFHRRLAAYLSGQKTAMDKGEINEFAAEYRRAIKRQGG
jgi:hypothetical protein